MTDRPWIEHYDESVPKSIDYEAIPLPGFLERTVAACPERDALVFMNARMSYRELGDQVDRLATAFARMGVEPGERIAIQLPNLPQTVIAYFAALKAGAQVVLTNPMYTGPEIVHQWNDSQCVVAVTMDFIFDRTLKSVRDQLPVRDYVVASIPEYLRFPLNLLAPLKLRRQDPPLWARIPDTQGVHFFKTLVRRTPRNPTPQIDFEDVAVLQYTGGTTGVSKGAMLTHKNLSVNVQQINSWFGGIEHGAEVMLSCLPLFHVFGMTVAMNWAVSQGMTMVLMPNPRDIDMLVKCLSKHRVTIFPGVPALYNSLNNYDGIDRIDVSSVKACFSGSAPIPVETMQRFEELTGAVILEGFGMSETSPVTHVNPMRGERKLGSIGMPMPDTDAKVVDVETGEREVAAGEEGELIVRGPQVMKGYWNQAEETAKTLRDGWLYTGDLAVMDEDGYFRIVGRKKDMINCGGFKVFPDEVDRVLMAHDAILEAATIGVPDEKRGETVQSFLVLRPGMSLSADEVRDYCRDNLAAYKIPREIEFLDELPKSSVLKVLRRELRDRVARRTG